MVKLHRQFGHTLKDKFIVFMKDAGVLHSGLEMHLEGMGRAESTRDKV